MLQDLVLVVASAFLAPVVVIGAVVLIRKTRSSLAMLAEERALSQPLGEQLAGSRVASAAITQPAPIEDVATADAPGPVSVDQPTIVIIGGQPSEWGQPATGEPQPRKNGPPAGSPGPSRPAPAWPNLVRNAGVVLLAVAVIGIAAIAISPNLGAATPSGGVLGATAVPSSPPVPSASALDTHPSGVSGVSAAVIAALRGTAVVNDRLAVDAEILQTELARKGVRAVDLARPLRSLVSDTQLGASLANRLDPWPDADPFRADLKSFYQAVAETARDGLRAPLSDLTAYRAAASSMLTVVAELRAIDAASRDLAKTVSVKLPPISVPLPE